MVPNAPLSPSLPGKPSELLLSGVSAASATSSQKARDSSKVRALPQKHPTSPARKLGQPAGPAPRTVPSASPRAALLAASAQLHRSLRLPPPPSPRPTAGASSLRRHRAAHPLATTASLPPSLPKQILKDLDDYYEKFKRETDAVQKRRMLHCIQRALIRSQELGDEKIQIVSQMVELVENRTRQVDSHVELFETCQETNDTTGNSGKASQDKSKNETIAQAEKPNNKRSRRQRNNENRENASNNHDHDDITSGTPKEKKAKTSKKKKRSKAKAEREASPPDLPIDPNEPTYCLCNQVSYGEMIGCDNDECPIEWFHFSCVGLNHKPKGKWYCPKCRGENEKTMDKALEKSKKERAYNR
ncbi:inhibitor of growth protein 1 isoform X2 [Ciconia boyciana]|uniref:inhibitor of growth protein 1 isoform X2 n=1 Tax=Ciconia boyciana TaxID=52775 RepID=UPI003B9F09F0